MAHHVTLSGRFRGRQETFSVPKPAAGMVTFRIITAGLRDMQRAINEAAARMLLMTQAFAVMKPDLIDEERAAYAAFIKDGGDPNLIRIIEERHDVDTLGIPTTT